MRTTCNALCDFTVSANDGELGKIKDIYFDDESWAVRYLVVDTRKWLPGRKVLLAPKHVQLLDSRNQVVRFDLTRAQIREAPPLEEHLPVTRAHEIALHDFFGWSHYWIGSGSIDLRLPFADAGPRVNPVPLGTGPGPGVIRQEGEPHLESCKDLQGYDVQVNQAGPGRRTASAGRLWDFVVNYVEWNVPFFVVEEDLKPGSRKFVLPTDLITAIDTGDAAIRTETPSHSISAAPGLEDVSQLGGGTHA